jgi:hypothetical protein
MVIDVPTTAAEIGAALRARLPGLPIGVRGDFITIGTRQPRLIAFGPLDAEADELVNRAFLSGAPVAIIHEADDLDRALGVWGLA